MLFQNKTRRHLAWLTALTLLFSYAEMLLPRIVPFFRLGLGNIAILAALPLAPGPFFLLTVLKAVAASLMAGTLFSPFVLISLGQSILSGLLMYGLFHMNRLCKNKLLSLYGISLCGSALSAVVQIALSSLYLGRGTYTLLGPMLIFNAVSGILTAFLCQVLELEGGSLPLGSATVVSSPTPSNGAHPHTLGTICLAVLILVAAAGVFFLRSVYVLAGAFVLSLIFQKISGRKIMVIPYISLWLFVLISSILIPEGKILFSLGNFSITQGALLSGIQKALKLSTVCALSQCAANLRPSENTLLGLSLSCYRRMLDVLNSEKGSVLARVKKAIRSQ